MANNTWSNYTEKTATPVDTDEVMARDSTDGKNKRLLFGTFWKWVAKKLNEATISELQTSNKTIVGALNQLNSDKLSGNGTYRIEYVRAKIPILNNGITTIDLKEYNSNIPNKQIAYCTVCGFGFNSVGVMSCNIISTSKIEVFNSGISLSDITLKFLLMYEKL
nr:MAG TPA: hypothetical protein [Bacteriophage sp.]